jgi:hypothetical protein
MMIGNSEEHRLILYFARRGATVWLAHLDNMRLFERAFNRAGWPIALGRRTPLTRVRFLCSDYLSE